MKIFHFILFLLIYSIYIFVMKLYNNGCNCLSQNRLTKRSQTKKKKKDNRQKKRQFICYRESVHLFAHSCPNLLLILLSSESLCLTSFDSVSLFFGDHRPDLLEETISSHSLSTQLKSLHLLIAAYLLLSSKDRHCRASS